MPIFSNLQISESAVTSLVLCDVSQTTVTKNKTLYKNRVLFSIISNTIPLRSLTMKLKFSFLSIVTVSFCTAQFFLDIPGFISPSNAQNTPKKGETEIIIPEGKTEVTIDGTRFLKDGTVILKDGTKMMPNGDIVHPNGSVSKPETF